MEPITSLSMNVEDIRSGDLLAWSKYPYNGFSDFLIKSIAFLTGSPFGHVGIAWSLEDVLDKELFVVEASLPKVQISRVTDDKYLYCIPARVEVSAEVKKFLLSRIGLPYGIMDAFRPFIGKPAKKDDHYQCAELCHEFYSRSGIFLPREYRPGDVVMNLITAKRTAIYKVIPRGEVL